MGLDMYLYKRKGREEATEIAYWRKENHIHNWFCNKLNSGEETNCEELKITKETLKDFIADGNAIIKDNNLAESLMPTKSGYFFGVTDYDESYFSSIKETIEIFEEILKEWDNKYTYFYYAWW